MKQGFDRIDSLFGSYKEDLIATMKNMIAIKSISPKSGGEGESKRADFLEKILKSWGFETKRHEYKDDTGTSRPSILARMGNERRTVWYVGHIDTVSEGERSLWKADPFDPWIEGDRIYGRGTNDNGQGIIASMYAMKALAESGLKTKYGFGLALVADEEIGSKYGMQKLVEDGLFGKEDMFVVPDWQTQDGSRIEVGEKGILWLKITITGKQMHASKPEMDKNAYRQMIRFLNDVDVMLHSKYSKRNALFEPDISTFEMTKHEKNVDSVNIMPGSEVSYIDCRILPDYKIDDVVADVKSIAALLKFSGVKIALEEFMREDPAPITDPKSEIVVLLESAIKDMRGQSVKKVGIGGGTCAAFPRRAGMQAVVWSTGPETAHQPNEYANISEIISDAKVFAYMML